MVISLIPSAAVVLTANIAACNSPATFLDVYKRQTQRIVESNHLTTLMITHNMKDAIAYGNRLIMLHEGQIIIDVSGEEKKNLTVEDLLTCLLYTSRCV